MDIVDAENVKIPNSVIISGLTHTSHDEELTDFLIKYGRISRTLRIDDPQSPHHNSAIVEYESGAALAALEPLLPHTLESQHGTHYRIRALSAEYMAAVTKSATYNFFNELQKISKLTGQSFEAVLTEHLSKCSQSIGEAEQTESPVPIEGTSHVTSPIQSEPEESPQPKVRHRVTESVQPTPLTQAINIPQSFIAPPEVQKVVVEHIVRTEPAVSSASASFRLRQFSGKIPCPSHEVDFDTWRNSVDLVLQDPELSDLQRSQKILDSLLQPAANIVKPLGPKALPSAYIELLTSAFGMVEDGDELFAKFLNTLQNAGEKPSQFLHRLQTALSKAQSRGGVLASEADRHLLRQFCRGCWDRALLADLQLERKNDNPPPFAELLLQLRVEEDKRLARENRMKRHFAAARPKVASNTIAATTELPECTVHNDLTEIQAQITELQNQLMKISARKADKPATPSNNQLKELRAQVTELQSHLARPKPPNFHPTKVDKPKASSNSKPKQKVPDQTTAATAKGRPRPWYCFQCGEDGHIVSSCPNEPNPSLVADKRQQLKEKQSIWDKQNNQNQPLN